MKKSILLIMICLIIILIVMLFIAISTFLDEKARNTSGRLLIPASLIIAASSIVGIVISTHLFKKKR